MSSRVMKDKPIVVFIVESQLSRLGKLERLESLSEAQLVVNAMNSGINEFYFFFLTGTASSVLIRVFLLVGGFLGALGSTNGGGLKTRCKTKLLKNVCVPSCRK
uniref:Uncharacterized protein n=1 Tax=Cacopsylla melanoneura TaxID=428564 RepID=A0A8D8TWC4_9HEMI